jgi:hypothetical protein
VQVCGLFLFVFLWTPCLEILPLLLFGGGSCFIFSMLFGAHFSMLLWAYFFNDPSLLLQEYKERNLLGTMEYLFLVGGWHVLRNSRVEVSMYMWVYLISIIGAWKDFIKGHNNLAKLNGSRANICGRFIHWYWYMALVGDMTIEELILFYFLKRNHPRFSPYYEIEQDQHCLTISY